ncbi:thiazole synthase [Veillonella agrestimuris]|uniref:thiazole synthase n=1 Tax=Veillonella agrestimuris TaxID=2941340 RepID=UPI00203C92EE|nr:thiazole synthase [Veillonella agrestimuris]
MADAFTVRGHTFTSRLLVGTGKFGSHHMMQQAIQASHTDIVTVALRRVGGHESHDNILNYIPEHIHLMPNTSGARSAEEAVRIARMARALGCGTLIKIEVIRDQQYLLPDNQETIKATDILANEGFTVFPYMSPDLMDAKRLVDAGAATVMPLAAPIGSNRGLETKGMIEILIDEIDVPIIVDAGIGKPSEAAEAMELGADAVLVNTAIASSDDSVLMAEAFYHAVIAGRQAYLAKCGAVQRRAVASSPLTGFLRD